MYRTLTHEAIERRNAVAGNAQTGNAVAKDSFDVEYEAFIDKLKAEKAANEIVENTADEIPAETPSDSATAVAQDEAVVNTDEPVVETSTTETKKPRKKKFVPDAE